MTLNIYSVIILAALGIDYGLGVVSDWLNLRHAAESVPPEFKDVYSAEDYARSQQYLRAETRAGLVQDSVGLGLLIGFWFAGGFSWLDAWCRHTSDSAIVRGLLFIGVLLLCRALISVPFSWYHTFVLDERFGFNRTTIRTFILDRVKALALSIGLGVPLIAAILWFFMTLGSIAWLACWATTVTVSLVVQYIAPVWIMPLFNRFTPLPAGPLREAILAYCHDVGFPVHRLFSMDGSRRSSRTNAFVAGFGRFKRIALFDTLIDSHTIPEVVSIVAHEVGHWKKHHIQIATLIGVLHAGIVFYLLSIVLGLEGLFDAFGTAPSVYAGLVFFGLLYSPVELVLAIAINAFSRRNERAADRFSARTYGRPEALAKALKTLSVDNLANLTPHPLKVMMSYSHPPILERVRTLKQKEQKRNTQRPCRDN